MLIGPRAVRLLRIKNTIGNFIHLCVVKINIVRANPQCSAENARLR